MDSAGARTVFALLVVSSCWAINVNRTTTGAAPETELGFPICLYHVHVNRVFPVDKITDLSKEMGIQFGVVDNFGRHYENDMVRTVPADEVSPDTCRLWDMKTDDKLDKDRFRRDLGGLVEAYQEVASRLGILNKSEPQKGGKPVLVKSDRAEAANSGEKK